jgi:phospholipid-binding lipoprotein MlaA
MKKLQQALLSIAIPLLLGACATVGSNPADPWEGANRKVFVFNDKLDTYALKPLAEGYRKALPQPARTGISNFFGNVDDVWVSFNNLIQGKPSDSLSDIGRFAINTTIGVLGLFDVASDMGLEKHDEDLGQTLAVWGIGGGPYVVLPLFGPSTVRDAGGLIVTHFVYNPSSEIGSIPVRNTVTGLNVVNTRAKLLGMETTLDEAALDKYAFMRNFYLQNRRSLIYDGHPPRPHDDYYDDPAPEPTTPDKVKPEGPVLPGPPPVPVSEPATGQ